MAWKPLVLLVALASANVSAFECVPGNMNALADSFILNQRRQLVPQGLTTIQLQKPGTFHEIDGMKVSAVAFGLDSIKRTGNVTLCIDKYENREVIEAEVGFDYLLLLATSLRLPSGELMSASFRVKGLSFGIAFSDNPDHTQCGFDHFGFTPVFEVRISTANKSYDGEDVTEFFNSEVIPYANSQLSGLREKLADEIGCISLRERFSFMTNDVLKHFSNLF